jgi:hypothetical protein
MRGKQDDGMTYIETAEDNEKDLREMKVKRQRQKAVKREEQASIINKAQGSQRARAKE